MSCGGDGTAGSAAQFDVPIYIYQGDDFGVTVWVQTGAGMPFDLTGYTVLAQIREGKADDTPVVLTMTTAVIPTESKIVLSIPHTQTALLKAFQYYWDLELTSPQNIVRTIVGGPVVITQEVSRAAAQEREKPSTAGRSDGGSAGNRAGSVRLHSTDHAT